MPALFDPIQLGNLALANRIAIAPMCQYSAVNGEATDWHLMHLGNLAQSGAGLLIVEATAVEPVGRISPADLGLWSDTTEAALGRALKGARKHSAMPVALQLAHAGRKASTRVPWEGGGQIAPKAGGWRTVSPSALPFAEGDAAPATLAAPAMTRIREAFSDAARRAHRLGIDAIEVHAAHGYLLHQFLSPLANQRQDTYGGSLENRMRYPLEVFDAVRSAFPAGKPVGIRLSACDWVEGGWNLEESVAFARELAKQDCAWIHVSSGGLSSLQQIPVAPGFQVPFAERIRRESGLPTLAVGLITEPEQAQAIVAEGRADMVALARAMLYDPRWPWHAAAKLGARVEAAPQYWRCLPAAHPDLFKR